MSSQRPAVLMAVLLTLILGYVSRPYWYPKVAGYPVRPADAPPLPGRNSISGLEVRQDEKGAWKASFDYFYTGEPRYAHFMIQLMPQPGLPSEMGTPGRRGVTGAMAERGQHHVSVELHHPGLAATSRQVTVNLQSHATGNTPVVSQQIEQIIDWPDWQTWMRDQEFAGNSPQQMLDRAVVMIDSNQRGQLPEAKAILERLVNQDPRFEAGYIELARVAMKSNWGPEGLHHAENLLASALQIAPDSANAKILLGYVFAHQDHFAKADKLFAEAAASNPANLWLWANWGESLAMQGKFDQAVSKYREAITRPMTHDTYDRARADAYTHLLGLLERRRDLDGMESLYKQRMSEFGQGSCYSADYARFLLQQRGDAPGAIELARRALNLNCHDADSREVLGMAHYATWAEATGPQKNESLNQARIYLPTGPMPLYLLSTSDRTLSAAKQLIASGEKIDQLDNDKLTALAYALQKEDLDAAKRLLRLGARPETPVGYGDVPVALMPVMSGNVAAIRMMQQFGADYSKIRYQGATAFDYAKQSGDTELLEVLQHQAPVL